MIGALLLKVFSKAAPGSCKGKQKGTHNISRVQIDVKEFKEAHQGKTVTHRFYCADESIGLIVTEHWQEQGLLLVHKIHSSVIRTGQGEAMIAYLLKQYPNDTIAAVHAFGGTEGFWIALNNKFGSRVRALDMRLEEYQAGLNTRRRAFG